MEFQDVVRRRRMLRAFTDRPIPQETVERILANAQRGPSSGFSQGFEFLVFHGPEQTGRFWDFMHERDGDESDPAIEVAPLIIVPVAHADAYVRRYLEPDKAHVGRSSAEDWPAPYWFTDSAFAAMLILLTAVDAGLGAYYFSLGPTSREIPSFKEAFGIPDAYQPIGAIAIGYGAPDAPSPSLRRGRRQRAEVMHFGKW